jgi:hypothetical protein
VILEIQTQISNIENSSNQINNQNWQLSKIIVL